MTAQREVEQAIIPGFQGALGIRRDKPSIAASHVENLTETERLYTIDDIGRTMVELGISTSKEDADLTIKDWHRKFPTSKNDGVGALFQLIFVAAERPEVARKFEELHGLPFNIMNLRKSFGGFDLDLENANLPRTPEEKKLDQKARRRFLRRR